MRELSFEIDISGRDLFSRDYVICVASGKIIKGYKFNQHTIETISSKYGQNLYAYQKSKKQKALLKIKLYCTIIYNIFKTIKLGTQPINLKICRDFDHHEQDIIDNLRYFLGNKLNLNLNKIDFCKLDHRSDADRYAYLMKLDVKNQMKAYVNLSLEALEEFIKK